MNFNGTGVVIRDSFNVSSITDNGNGDYTVNFTNGMSDVTMFCLEAASENVFMSSMYRIVTGQALFAIVNLRINTTCNNSVAAHDAPGVNVVIFSS